jgi:hypothetical protein
MSVSCGGVNGLFAVETGSVRTDAPAGDPPPPPEKTRTATTTMMMRRTPTPPPIKYRFLRVRLPVAASGGVGVTDYALAAE